MKPRQSFPLAGGVAVLLLLVGASGCVTLETRDEQVAQQQQEIATQQTISRLKTQVESILAQQDQLQQQMQQLRLLAQDRATAGDVQRVQADLERRLADLDRRIAAVDAARAQDRQEIVNTLSKNVSSAMAQIKASSARSSAPAPAPSYSGKAYEHVVARGDTLSAIATAYKVPASKIIAVNNLKNPGNLSVGQKLLIPVP